MKAALGIKELSDSIASLQERVGKAIIAGNQCNDATLVDKMNLVQGTVEKAEEKVMDMLSGFQDGAARTLTDLKASWEFSVDRKGTLAIRRVGDVCKTTETLAKQVHTLNSHMRTQIDEMQWAVDNLVVYQKDVKANHERLLQELKEEKELYRGEIQAAKTAQQESEKKAHECAVSARKEMEAWEKVKAKRGAGLNDILDDVFGVEDHKPYEKRRDNFLKEERYHLDKAEESKLTASQNQFMMNEVEERVQSEEAHFLCINDAIMKMKDAFGRIELTMVGASLFEQDLKTDCEDLSNEMKQIGSYWLRSTKDAALSDMCDTTTNLYAKWKALLATSSEIVPSKKL